MNVNHILSDQQGWAEALIYILRRRGLFSFWPLAAYSLLSPRVSRLICLGLVMIVRNLSLNQSSALTNERPARANVSQSESRTAQLSHELHFGTRNLQPAITLPFTFSVFVKFAPLACNLQMFPLSYSPLLSLPFLLIKMPFMRLSVRLNNKAWVLLSPLNWWISTEAVNKIEWIILQARFSFVHEI